jgi:hypothetical protein
MMPAMKESVVLERLAQLRSQARAHLAIHGLASLSLVFVSVALVSFGLDRVLRLPVEYRAAMLGAMLLVTGTLVWRRLVRRLTVPLPLVELARAVEKRNPKLDWRLVSAVQFLENQDPRGSRELAQLVVAEAEQAAQNVTFSDVLDGTSLGRRGFYGGLVVFCALALVKGFPHQVSTWFQRCVLLSTTAEWPKATNLIVTAQSGQVVTEFHPGKMHVAVPRGSDLAIIVSALGEVPLRATVSFEFLGTHIRGSRPLARLGDNRFRHVFEKIVEDCDFWVRGGDDEVGPIHVSVVRPPWLDSLEIVADMPRYTIPALKVAQKKFGIEAGEMALPAGTQVTINAHCTKQVLAARLDVRYAGVSLEAPPERHGFVSGVVFQRGLEEARLLDEANRPRDAVHAYLQVADLARSRLDAADERVAPLASYAAALRALEAEPQITGSLAEFAKDPRLTKALEPSVAPTASLSFTFVLDKTAACMIDLDDSDALSLERPVSLTLRSIPDAPPKVELVANGIGQLVTPNCVIPIEIHAKDEYGLTRGVLKFKTAGANQKAAEGYMELGGLCDPDEKGNAPREVQRAYPWDLDGLRLAPGTFLTFLSEVSDNDPKGAKSSASSAYALRVVAPEELLMDLIRRQHEIRRELERVKEDEVKLAEGLDSVDTKAEERAGKKQREVQKTVADAARAMNQVVDEMRNNKLLDERARTRLQEDVVTPLETLRDGELVHARDLSDAILPLAGGDRDSKSKEAGASTHEVVTQLDAIIAHMKRVADLAELVARLREFLKKERDLMEETRKASGQ